MKKFISILLSLTLIMSTPIPISAVELTPSQNKVQTIQKLKTLSNGNLKLSEKDGQLFLTGNLAKKQVPSEKSATKFLEENKLLFGIDSATDDLKTVEVKKDDIGHTYVKYVQLINGIKVNGSGLNVHFDKNGVIVSVSGKLEKNKSVTTLGKKTISESAAVEIAKKQYTYKTLRNTPKVEKLILTKDDKNYEVFKVNISYIDPTIGNYDVFVEAHSGKVIKTENNIRYDGAATGTGIDVLGKNKNLNLYLSESSYLMNDVSKSATSNILTYSLNHGTTTGDIVSNSVNVFNTEDHKASVSAHYNAGIVIDYYKNLFNRNSLDNNGMIIKSFTHFDSNYNNAFWTGSEMVYGDGDGDVFTYLSGDLDVVGHEMTHGVISNTANLEYHNQSGALNESMADVFGVLISTYDKYNVASGGNWAFNTADWVVGDDIYTPNIAGDALRSLSNPTLYNQPDNMNNYEYSDDTEDGDWGGVHTNSGIPNKAAYLVAKTIGMAKTSAIYYRALVTYMDAYTNFEQSKNSLVQAATDLYGQGSSEVTAINDAYSSVGVVGQPPVEDPYEPNNTIESAYPIDFGSVYQSYITTNTDVDYYSLNVTSPGEISVSLSDLPCDYDLYLFSPSGEIVGYSEDYGTTSEFININATEAGNYYIKVYAYSEYSTTQKYSLTATKPATAVTGVSLDRTTASLKVNEAITLVATVNPTDSTNKNVTWLSSNTSVATVNNVGKVTAVGAGTATITVTTEDGGYKATCSITAQNVQVTGISLNKTTAGLKKGESIGLIATVNPANATNKNVKWSSSDISVANVNSVGTVTAVGAGTATITVTTDDGGYKTTCSITATNPVTGVILDRTTAGLKIGESVNITATIIPGDAPNNNATWSSSNSSVATVDNAGKVTAVGLGTTAITITTAEGGFKASCNIVVFEVPVSPVDLQAVPASYNSIKISWTSVSGASGYEIYRSTSSNGTYSKVGEATASTYTDSGLVTGTNYYYKLRSYTTVFSNNSYGDYSSVVTANPVLAAPQSPVAVSLGYNSIKISWNTVAGASGSEIYRSASSNGTYSKVGEAVASNYTNTGLTTATTYYYKVRSYVTVGTARIYGGYSSIVSAKPIPSAPSSFKAASASYISNKITWGAVSGASGYQLFRASSSTGTYSLINTTTALSYVNTALKTGTTYYYKARSYRTVGTTKVYSLYTPIVSAAPVPATPASLKTVSASYSSININWGTVKEASGYQLYRSTSSTGTYSLVRTTTALSYTNTGLKTGIAYFYKVRSYKLVGTTNVFGNFSAAVSARPIPAVPTSPKAASISYNSIKTSWVAAGGATGYYVYRSTSSTGTYALIASTTSTSYINTALATNRTYYYKIRSYNSAGTSQLYSGFSSVVSAKPIPTAPTSVKSVSSSYVSINVTWAKVIGASGYEVYRSLSKTGTYTKINTTSAISCNNTGLTFGKIYYYKVRSYTTVGTTKVYSSYSAVVSAKPAPLAPVSVKAAVPAYNIINTSWGAVSGASGYQVFRSTSSTGTYTLLTTTTSTSYNNTGLAINKPYYYKIKSYRTVGTTKYYSGYSVAVSAATRSPYAPMYSAWATAETSMSTSYVKFYIKNNGPTTLRIYSAGSNLVDDDYFQYDRDLQLVDSTTWKDITKIEFPAGKEGWVYFKVKGDPTWYDPNSKIEYEFTYDNLWYYGSVSYNYGIWYTQK